MIFADTSAQFIWTQFGFAGVVLCALTYLATRLFALWLKAKENEHQKTLDIQLETQLESLKQLSKRDEIRFSKFHVKQADLMAELYTALADLHDHSFKVIPGGAMFGQDKVTGLIIAIEQVQKFIKRNQIYFSDDLTTLVNQFLDELYKLGVGKQSLDNSAAAGEWMKDAWEKLTKQLPSVLTAIRTELKSVLDPI